MKRILKRRTLGYDSIPNEWAKKVTRAITQAGQVWSVATDLKGMLAIRDGGKAADGEITNERLRKFNWDYLAFEADNKQYLSLFDVRCWLEGRKAERCLLCPDLWRQEQGYRVFVGAPRGYNLSIGRRRQIRCNNCIGKCRPFPGYVWPHRQSVRICGVLLDPQLLATYLPRALGTGHATFGTKKTTMSNGTPIEMLVIKSDQIVERGGVRPLAWRALVCGLNPAVRDDASTAPTYHDGIGALWHLRNTPGRGILSDWCEDRGIDLREAEGQGFVDGSGTWVTITGGPDLVDGDSITYESSISFPV